MKLEVSSDRLLEVIKEAKSHLEISDYWWEAYQDSNETDSAALRFFREDERISRAMLQTVEMLTGIYVPNRLVSIENVINAIEAGEEIPQYV